MCDKNTMQQINQFACRKWQNQAHAFNSVYFVHKPKPNWISCDVKMWRCDERKKTIPVARFGWDNEENEQTHKNLRSFSCKQNKPRTFATIFELILSFFRSHCDYFWGLNVTELKKCDCSVGKNKITNSKRIANKRILYVCVLWIG